jgi:hypothetical protein
MLEWLNAILRRVSVVTGVIVVGLVLYIHQPLRAAENPSPESGASSLSVVLSKPRIKFITTTENVVYRVTYQSLSPYLSEMGDPRRWSLWCAGKPVPMLVKGEEDGRFNRKDYIEWYAPALRTPYNHVAHGSFDNDAELKVRDAYTTQAAYFLHFSPGISTTPLRLRDIPTTVPLKGRFWPLQTYRRFRHYEQDSVRRNFKPDPNTEYTDGKLWDFFSWPSRPFRDYYIRLIGLATDSDQPCSMTIKLWGENQPRKPDVHQARISINGIVVGEARWQGVRQCYFTTTTLSPKIFKEWSTRISVEATSRSSPDLPDMMLLDWIEISYPSYYRAEDDVLDFVAPAPPDQLPAAYQGWLNPLALEAFLHEPVWLLDLTTGERQQLPMLRKWRLRGQNHINVYLPIAKTGHRYFAYTPESLRTPSVMRFVRPDRLRSGRQGADYVIITHEKFVPEATRLAKHRSRLGLRSMVVTTDEIANSFHEGFTNVVAIKEFIRQAYKTWNLRPRFVALVGDASWDDLGIQGGEFANYLPTYYYRSPWLGFYSSDNWFVSLESSNDLPDLAIGRIPVRSLAEMRAYVDKVVEYDTQPAKGDWRRSALLISSHSNYSHEQLNEIGRTALKDFDIVRCFATANVVNDDAYATTVTRYFDLGHVVALFAGHGGSFVWQVGPNIGNKQAPDLFSPRQVAQLTNRGKYPLVLALTCYTNSFDNPMMQTIGESLILEPQRGAIAVISSTWRGALENEFPLTIELLARLRENASMTVGEALMAAKRALQNSEDTHGVCLLGDPALRIYFDSRPNNQP